jgi:hypothetical protein
MTAKRDDAVVNTLREFGAALWLEASFQRQAAKDNGENGQRDAFDWMAKQIKKAMRERGIEPPRNVREAVRLIDADCP